MIEYEHLTAGEKLDYIIRQRLIYPVFQPIVSLRDGKTLGFEALSRISVAGLFENVEEMFLCAEEEGKVWGLERSGILSGKAFPAAEILWRKSP